MQFERAAFIVWGWGEKREEDQREGEREGGRGEGSSLSVEGEECDFLLGGGIKSTPYLPNKEGGKARQVHQRSGQPRVLAWAC